MRGLHVAALLLGLAASCSQSGGGDALTVDMGADGGLSAAQRRWTVIRPPAMGQADLFSVWGATPDHFFAVGQGGTIVQAAPAPSGALDVDGQPLLTFTAMKSPTTQDLQGVSGTSATNVYAVGLSGTIVHYDGNAWTVQAPAVAQGGMPFTTDLFGVIAYRQNAVAVGAGGAWLQAVNGAWGMPPAALMVENLSAVTGVPSQGGPAKYDIYAVGTTGYAYHYDETTWEVLTVPDSFTTNLSGVFASAWNNVYAVGLSGSVLRQWPPIQTPPVFLDYGALVNAKCGSGAVPQDIFRGGAVTAAGAAVLIGWNGAIVRLTEGTCQGMAQTPIVSDESGVTQNRLDGIWSNAAVGQTTPGSIYIAGADGIVIRGY